MRRYLGLVLVVACSSGYAEAPDPPATVDAGSDGGSAVDPEAGTADAAVGAPGCPSGRGAAMVRVTVDAWDFCIDTTEATVGQYQAFLDSLPSLDNQPLECAKNGSYASTGPMNDPLLPVEEVSICDARAFCAWAGKRLCGGPKGAHVTGSQLVGFKESEWMAACTRYGTRAAPYGSPLDPTRCNIGKDGGTSAQPGTSNCPGGFDGIVDMIGNVNEWENNCEPPPDGGAFYQCQTRGAYYRAPAAWGRCEQLVGTAATAKSIGAGIRCCADPN